MHAVEPDDPKDTTLGQIVKPADKDVSIGLVTAVWNAFVFLTKPDKVLTSQGATLMLKLLVVFTGKISLHMLSKATCHSAGIFESFEAC